MIVRLDPFHLIRGINCPEPGVLAPDVGSIFVADDEALGVWSFLWGCQLRETPDVCPRPTFDPSEWVYSQFIVRLPSNIVFCNQMKFQITGRTSGVSKTWDMEQVLLDASIDCETATIDFCEGRFTCFGLVAGDWVESPLLGGERNVWLPAVPEHFVRANILTQQPIGYALNERVDVTLPSFDLPIDTIVSGTAGRARISPTGGNPGIVTDANVKVEGTAHHDGRFNATFASASIIEIDTPFIAEETGVGTVAPDYVP